MSTIEATSKWLERTSDWMNPILVKETRQALKSRQFVITFLLLLAAAWTISAFGMLSVGAALEYGAAGRAFFSFYMAILSTAIFVIVPYGAFRSLLTERDQNTYELLSITTLSPRQIVWGKVLSSLVQVLIYYSAIAPFIAFTSLLQGFDLSQVTFVLFMSVLLSLAYSMVALMLGAVARHKYWQALMSLVVLGALVWQQIGMFVLLFSEGLDWLVAFDDPDFWWGLGIMLAVGISYVLLAQEITVSQLTFASGNRSSGIRVIGSAQFFLLWTALFGYHAWEGTLSSMHHREIIAMAIVSAIHLSAIGFIVATETDFLSRRIRRLLPKRPVIRWVTAPFVPGGHRGMLYVVLHLLALWLLAVGAASWTGHLADVSAFTTALCCYVVIYIGLGVALGRWGRLLSSDIRPAHVRVIILLLFAAGQIAPMLPYMMDLTRWHDGSPLFVTNVFETLEEIEQSPRRMMTSFVLLLFGAAVCLLINGRAMLNGVTELSPRPAEAGRRADSGERAKPA